MECILHIGANKTGTTSIQKTLMSNASQLKKQGFLYPRSGRSFPPKVFDRHAGLRMAVLPVDVDPRGLAATVNLTTEEKRAVYRKDFIEAFDLELLANKDMRYTVVSDEALFLFSDDLTAQGMFAFLKERFQRTKVIVYLRRPDLYVASAYSQFVKMGGCDDFETFVESSLQGPKYFDLLQPWRTVFGKENIEVACFDRRFLRGGDAVADFLARIGVDSTDFEHFQVNESLSALGCEALRLVNVRFEGKAPRYFRRAFSRTFTGASVQMSDRMKGAVRDAFKDDHEKLVEAFGLECMEFYALDDFDTASAAQVPEDSPLLARKIADLALAIQERAAARSPGGRSRT
ncbi:hypothetical protein MRS76_18650 [Rhizobiaceae bacterium n13]|nr:hypothetical protein [Fererhizobium litorale]MDI7863971.1 hypothetical protein [Fererhizobium litorale]